MKRSALVRNLFLNILDHDNVLVDNPHVVFYTAPGVEADIASIYCSDDGKTLYIDLEEMQAVK